MHDDGSPLGTGKQLRDEERQITFEYLGSFAMGSEFAFRLDMGDKLVPVIVGRDIIDGTVVYNNVNINGSQHFENKFGIAGRVFDSPDEELAILHIVAECLLVYGTFYDGLTTLRGQCRVELSDGRYDLPSFGY